LYTVNRAVLGFLFSEYFFQESAGGFFRLARGLRLMLGIEFVPSPIRIRFGQKFPMAIMPGISEMPMDMFTCVEADMKTMGRP
jgi:hypothetical protein